MENSDMYVEYVCPRCGMSTFYMKRTWNRIKPEKCSWCGAKIEAEKAA